MADKQSLPTELEEKVQALAGDICVQVEDKLSNLLAEYTAKNALSDELVEQHSHYQQFKKTAETQQNEAEEIAKTHQEKINDLQNKIIEQQAQITTNKEALNSNLTSNSAKLSENESLLEEKLIELSAINEGLIKNDKAKTATVEAQNNQISELQLQIMKVTAESERIQSEQEHAIEEDQTQSNNDLKQQADDAAAKVVLLDKQIVSLNETIAQNIHQQKESEQLQTSSKEQVEELIAENSQLQQNITDADNKHKALSENQQQHEQSSQTHLAEIKDLQEQLSKQKEQLVLSNQKSEGLAQEHSTRLANIEKVHQLKLDELTNDITEKNNKSEQDQVSLKQMQEQIAVAQTHWQQQSAVEQQKYDELTERLAATELQQDQKQNADHLLKEQVESLKAEILNKQNIVEKNKEKQEVQFAQARETIKDLRDENLELNTKLEEQVSELENKLTEYRLRFEYAQKQLV